MSQIEFTAYGEPKGQPRPRAFARKFGDKWQARVYDAGTAEGWKNQVAIAARPFIPSQPIDEPISLKLWFYFPRPQHHYGRKKGQTYLKDSAPPYHLSKPDFDNTAKAVSDALTQLGFWRDDSLVAKCEVSKLYEQPYQRPGVRVVIETLSNEIKPAKEMAI